MKTLALILTTLASAAVAEGWQKLSGEEVQSALEGRKLVYANAWQDFRTSGRTLYVQGHESWGYWAVRGNQYCSKWPPSDLWACYDLEQSGEKLRFVASDGSFSEAVYGD